MLKERNIGVWFDEERINTLEENEKYIGDVLSQNTYIVNFLSGKRAPNDGILPKYYMKDDHEPIIPREGF